MRGSVITGTARWPHVLGALLLVVAAAVAALLVDTTPPAPAGRGAPATAFSAQRAAVDVARYGSVPHPNGSARAVEVRRELESRLRAAGLRVRTQNGVGRTTTEGGAALGRVENIVATLPGRNPTGSVLLVAHYDSVVSAPGAADDVAAVAAMLETVRALRAGTPLRNDVVLVITDGEEQGLLGASSFVRDDPLADRPGVVLNWEARGTSGVSLMFQTSTGNAKLIQAFAAGAPHPSGDSSLVELYRLLPNDTDFTELKTKLPGLNSAFIGDGELQHTPQDAPGYLDRGSLQQHGANMLGLTREFGGLDLRALNAPQDETYFRFLGVLVHYPDTVSTVLAGVAVLALLVFAGLLRRRGLASVPAMLGALVSLPVPLAVAAGLAHGLGLAVLALRPELADAMYDGTLFGLAAGMCAVLLLLLWYALLRGRLGPAALAAGGQGLLVVLGAGCVVLIPGMSFLFAVPALVAALGGIAALLVRGAAAGTAACALGAVPAVVLLVPFAVLNYTGLGLGGGGAAGTAIAAFLCGLLLLPLLERPLPVSRPAWPVALVALIAVVSLGASGLLAGQYDARHPKRSMLSYVLRTDGDTAVWASADADPDSWGRRFADGSADSPEVFRAPVRAGRAPAAALTGPLVRRDGDFVHVASRRGAPGIIVLLPDAPESLTVRVPGLRPVTLRPEPDENGAYRLEFFDLPAGGIDLGLPGSADLSVYDWTSGLSQLPGHPARPSTVELTASREDNTVFVGGKFTV